MYGPKGAPDPPPPVDRVTLVPWETVEEGDRKAREEAEAKARMAGKRSDTTVLREEVAAMQMPQQWALSDHDAIISTFGDPYPYPYPSRSITANACPRAVDDSRDVFDQDTVVGVRAVSLFAYETLLILTGLSCPSPARSPSRVAGHHHPASGSRRCRRRRWRRRRRCRGTRLQRRSNCRPHKIDPPRRRAVSLRNKQVGNVGEIFGYAAMYWWYVALSTLRDVAAGEIWFASLYCNLVVSVDSMPRIDSYHRLLQRSLYVYSTNAKSIPIARTLSGFDDLQRRQSQM